MAVSLGQEELGQVGSGHVTVSGLQGWKGPLWLPGEKGARERRKGGALNPTEESGSIEGASWTGSLGFPLADWGVGAVTS